MDEIAKFKKWLWIAIAAWSLLLCASFAFNSWQTWQSMLAQGRSEGRMAFLKDLSYRAWNASHGGVYVPVTESTQPDPWLRVPHRDVTTTHGQKLTLMNPAYMTRQVFTLAAKRYGIKGHITSLDPINPANAPDPWEKKALQAFKNNPSEISKSLRIKGEPFIRFMRPMITEDACLKCHSEQEYKVGDIRGGISVSFPISNLVSTAKNNIFYLALAHGAFLFIGILGLILSHKKTTQYFMASLESGEKAKADKLALKQERDMYVSGSVVVFKWQNREHWPVEYVSANIEDFLGYTASDFVSGKVRYVDIVHSEDRSRVAEEVKINSENQIQRFEHQPYRLVRANNEAIWVLDYTTIVRDEAGAISHYLGYLVNVTDRKHVQEKLKESENFLQTVFDGIQDPVHVIDRNYKVLLTNKKLLEMKNVKQEDIRGKYCYEAYQGRNELCEKCGAKEVFETGKPISLIKFLPLLDGTYRYFEVFSFPLVAKSGEVTQVIEMTRDITKRKQAEQQLHNEREKLFITLRSIGDGVITTDTDGRVTFINHVAEQLSGWSQQEAAGQPLHEVFNIINEKTGISCENPVNKVFNLGKIIGLANHTALIAKDGTRRSIADSAAPILDSEQKIIGVVLVFRDVSQKKKTEEEHLKIKKLESLGVLAGGIAHDFNNILTAILGNINLADTYIEQENEAHSLLTEAEKASIRAKNLTQQLLTFSKGGVPVRETAAIKQVISDSADFVLHGSKVTCRYVIQKDLWLVDIDTGQMSQVIQNLVINARHAMPEGGEIKISCENIADITTDSGLSLPGDNYIKISIADHGGGIPEKYLDKIFDPYFSTKQEGSGLGLAVTHSIINKHDGHIFVRSNSGEGTTFTIYLPASTEQTSSELEGEAQKPEKSVRGTILIMDDEAMIQNLAKKMLSRLGHQCLQAKNGEEAIAIFKEHHHSDNPVDVIIMDLTIPGGIGGKDAIKEILKIDPDAKAIVSSGYSNDPVMANYHQYGFKAAIGKPFKMVQLKETVNSVLG